MNAESPLDILIGEKEQINPAILLAEKFMRREAAELLSAEDINRAEETLQIGRMEIETINGHLKAFGRSLPTFSTTIPIGF